MSNSLKSKKDKADKKGRTVVEKTLSRKTAKVQLQSKLRTLLDFAEKNQIPFTAFYLHPEDEKEQAPVGFTNAGDAFIFQSIWTMITNNERVGIQFTRMLLEKQEKAMEESGIELPHKKKPMPFQEGDQVKLLWWSGDGMNLYLKRLERGRFVWPQATSGSVSLSGAQLSMLLEGIDWRHPQRTWQPSQAA